MEKFVTRVDKLTPEQEAQFASYRDKWIEIGLKTGDADFDTFDKYMPICYEKAGLKYPKNVVRVKSPLVGALAAALAEGIWAKRRGAVGGAVDDAVRGAVDGAVDDAVRGAVDDAVDDAVRGAVGDAVGGAVGDVVYAAILIAKKARVSITWHYWLGGQFWVGGWYWGVVFVSFFFDVCRLKLAKDLMERAEAYRKVSESVNYIWPNRDFVIVCDRPKAIHRNERGFLHNTRGKSIEYKDGYGLYHLNGVKFEEEMFYKIVDSKMSAADILSIPDIDQRTQALRFMPTADLIKELKGEMIDEVKKMAADGTITTWKLYKFPQGEVFSTDAFYILMDCPSTGKQHFEGVEVSKTVAEAMAWAMSNEFVTVMPEQWSSMIPLTHEN